MMATLDAEVLLEAAFRYPEHASFFCPIRTRARLLNLLADGSPLVYRRDGLIIWLSAGGHFVLYLAREAALLDEYLEEALATLWPHAVTEGAALGNVYTTSPAATRAFRAAGFHLDDGLQRMRVDHPTVLPPDPRIRRLDDADMAALAIVGQRAFPEQDWSADFWEEPLRGAEATWVAVVDGQPVGFLLANHMERFSLITGLAVDPACQGQGLGKALIQRATGNAAELELAGVEVHANDRPQAIATYERCGFHVMHPAWALSHWWGAPRTKD